MKSINEVIQKLDEIIAWSEKKPKYNGLFCSIISANDSCRTTWN